MANDLLSSESAIVTQSALSHLECSGCGQTLDPALLHGVCDGCGQPVSKGQPLLQLLIAA